MKKFSAFVLVVVLSLSLTACGKKPAENTDNPYAAMSWQEQYDLGIRLLNEGDYEEAILVFQAMIQIEPNRADGYHKLADVYVALGEYESAAIVLEEGFQATGVSSLEELLKDIQQMIQNQEDQKNQQGESKEDSQENETSGHDGQVSSPATPPELPEALVPVAEKEEGQILYWEEEYAVFTEDIWTLWEPVIEAGVNDDRETARAALEAMDVDVLKNISTVQNTDYVSSVTGWTLWQGDLLGYACHTTPEGNTSWSVEYRPENGMGFALSWSKRTDGANGNYYRGEMNHWLFDGSFQGLFEDIYEGEIVYTNATVGAASQELLQGDVTYRQESAGAPVIMLYYHYESGITQNVWVDPNDGESYPLRRVEIYSDGTESEVYMTFGEPEGLVLVNYVLRSEYVAVE